MDNEEQTISGLNTTPFINRAKVKDYALLMARQKWTDGHMDRVGKSFLERINDKVRQMIAAEVRAHPTIGKTLK